MLLEPPQTHWGCPSCDLHEVTRESSPHSRMHSCPGMAGLTVPMVPAGMRAEHRATEREDYIDGEQVQLDDNGRPVMSVTTTTDDREDLTVYAPTALGSFG